MGSAWICARGRMSPLVSRLDSAPCAISGESCSNRPAIGWPSAIVSAGIGSAVRSPACIRGLRVTTSLDVRVPKRCPLSRLNSVSSALAASALRSETCRRSGSTGSTTELGGARAHCRVHVVNAAVGGLHEDGNPASRLLEPREDAELVEIGHDQIEHDGVDSRRPGAEQACERGISAIGRDRHVSEPADHGFEQPTLHGIVTDDQDRFGHAGSPRAERANSGQCRRRALTLRETGRVNGGAGRLFRVRLIPEATALCSGLLPSSFAPRRCWNAQRFTQFEVLMIPNAPNAPAKTAVKPAPSTDLGPLPEWDLRDLYPSIDAPQVKRDLGRVDAECLAFEESYRGKLAAMAASVEAGRTLAEAVERYE